MKTRRIVRKKQLVALVGLMGIAGAALAGPAAAHHISGSQTVALPAEAKNKGYTLVVGTDAYSTPRLQDAVLTLDWSAHEALPMASVTLGADVPNCPTGTAGVIGFGAIPTTAEAQAFITTTISGATNVGGSFSRSVGPVGAAPSADGGMTLPPISLCEG